MRVLLLGDTSFVATGLRALLQSRGASVVAVSDNPVATEDPTVILGDLTHVGQLSLPGGAFDALINFVTFDDRSLEENVAFVEELARFVEARRIPHLIHLSSLSVYANELQLVTEYSALESAASRREPEARTKIATDRRLTELYEARAGLTLVRPGFVLGTGLADPIAGTGWRMPGNNLLVLGSSNAVLPLVTRQQVHEALWASLRRGPSPQTQILLLADHASPTRAEYLRHCTRGVGAGRRIVRLGSATWLAAGACAVAVAKSAKLPWDPWRAARTSTRVKTYDGTVSETLLGVPIDVNWKKELQHALPGQFPNFEVPGPLQHLGALPPRDVIIIGCGHVVEQHHLPALRRLGLDASITAFDVRPRTLPGVDVRELPKKLEPASLMLVASPGHAHTGALELLPGGNESILIDAPLCSNQDELDQWCAFADRRSGFTGVAHNFRAKENVRQLLLILNTYNPGRILSASVTYHGPPLAHDTGPSVLQQGAQTLLLDEAVHYLDVGMMFGSGDWSPRDVRFTINHSNETDFIGGVMSGDTYDVSFNLRRGFGPRAARVEFVFQNYRAEVSFSPDVFNVEMSGDDLATTFVRGARQLRETVRRVTDRLRGTDSDRSHDLVLGAAANGEGFSVHELAPFYRGVLALSEQLYGAQSEPKSGKALKMRAV